MLLLTEGQDGLWERFQRDRRAPELASLEPVVPRWTRALELGVRADTEAHPIAVRGHELAVRRDTALGVLGEGTGVVEALEAEVTSRGLVSLVADPNGVIVRARGGGIFSSEVKRTRLVEGACWSEDARGTNAIGTALVEKTPVAVVGRAHWEAVNHGLYCYAAPVVDAFGELAAILDVTGPVELDTSAIGAAVRSAAAAMQQVLRMRAYARTEAGSLRLVERMVERCGTPVALVESPGVVRARNAAAAAELDLGSGDVAVERLFGLSWEELVRSALGGPASFETRRRTYSVEFEPVIAEGRVLALVCFFSAAAPRPRPVLETPRPLPPEFARIVAHDPAVVAAKQLAAKLAPSDVPVLLLAETGTGKELFADAIHRASTRASGSFVAVNCGALSGSLLESELFGYAPGAFTGASARGAEGKVAAADKGTLFLDEVAEMSPQAQAMLLRFLEDGTYSRVGDAAPRRADVRLICATCKDLPKLVRDGVFRHDLFFRIQGGYVKIPTVRERSDRIPLARAILAQLVEARARKGGHAASVPELGPSAEAWILDHSWPGNVRELKTALSHALAVSGGEPLGREHFPQPLLVPTLGARLDEPAPSRRAALRALANEAMTRAGGNVSEAARTLGVARSTLYRMLGKG